MEDFLEDLLNNIEKEEKAEKDAEKKRLHFSKIGQIGGKNFSKSINGKLSKMVVVRFKKSDYGLVNSKAKNLNLSVSEYIRLVATEKELTINEFLLDDQLIYFGNSFKRISNIIKNSAFSENEKRQELIDDVANIVREIREYLYNRLINKENEQ